MDSTKTYSSSNHLEQLMNIKFDPTFLPVVATSFTLFMILYKFINPFISNLLVPSYKTLSETKKIDWNTRYSFIIFNSKYIFKKLLFRINSSINSLIVGTICVYMLIADHGLDANPLV